ncbi:Sphingolipid alpha-hydroxylase/fatty acid hydroxylase/SCS7 [Blumeria hordei DH14]|uniref:Ceramide very long chain fatty acid hydroxylase n=1 Tax=Blumeria graminis f. sp. hordei (strain DH14) TaxID=546991 RepID=N1JRB3_BLUG1|nr:Sphingolipid alpha-hydroxylase/fatty acid hydroxylase/SCS7 [Blumeria hordei DH14]
MSPSRTMPSYLQTEVGHHNTTKSCYVIYESKVCDITDFLDSHPGGAELILEFAGKDVTEILGNAGVHKHSDAAYEILDDSIIGFVSSEAKNSASATSKSLKQVPITSTDNFENKKTQTHDVPAHRYATTGMSSAEDLSKETDLYSDFKTHQFLDLNKPLLMQMWNGGFSKDFYLDQIHRPRHYKGGASAPLFGNFLEPLSKTAWWVVPMVWLPPVTYGTYISRTGFSSIIEETSYWMLGLFLWTLIEYFLHRFLFHLDKLLPDNRAALTLHFLLHGIHHYLPMDKLRLVMPPALFLILATPFWKLSHFVFYWNWSIATTVFCGGIFGYICYDLTHYFLHHKKLPSYWRELKKYHLQHHYMDYENGFGVTSRFWDVVFGTQLAAPPLKAT